MTNEYTPNSFESEQQLQSIETIDAHPVTENPSTWLKEGDSPAEILLAVAVLLSSLAGLLKVLIPLFVKPKNPKAE